MGRKRWITGFILLYTFCFSSPGWADYTSSKLVTLVISATDEGSGMGPGAEMRFSNDGLTWSEPEPFATVRENWDLTAYGGGAGDGQKTVYLKLKDSAGNWSTYEISDSIILELDTDGDGMPDWWEEEYGLDPYVDDANQDNDQDGYTNLEEYNRRCDPTIASITIIVPDDYSTIQAAIDAAGCGDTIWVAPGTYTENINFSGKVIIVMGSGADTIIDGGGIGSVVTFNLGEGLYTVLDGFVIKNGSSPIGGGIAVLNDSSPLIINNIIFGNDADLGGGIACDSSSPTIINNTIVDNIATSGGGIGCINASSPTVTNTILWDNGDEIYLDGSSITVTYSDVEGGYSGGGNIDSDPLFVDAASGDYNLQADSPCIDMGTAEDAPSDDIDGNLRPQGAGYDIGADEVAKTPTTPTIALHLNNSSFATGERETASVDITAPELPIVVDLYISLQLPDGKIYYYPYWSTFPLPILRSWKVVDLSTVFFDYTFEGHEPAGEYTWDAHFVEPGTDNVIGQPTSVSFTFSP